MEVKKYHADVVIAGGGIAGLIAAYELLKRNRKILLFDKDVENNLGGLAKESAGGIHLIGTPIQKRVGIKDDPELALRDWLQIAQFSPEDHWPKKWAEYYCNNSINLIYNFTQEIGIKFLLFPIWTERGLYTSGNSVPRWHVTNGTGYELIMNIISAINRHPNRKNLKIFFEHEVNGIHEDASASYFSGKSMSDGSPFTAQADHLVIATGGIGGGDLSKLKKHWPGNGKKAPEYMLNGAHIYGDGLLHDKIEQMGGNVTNLENNWLYAAGVHHPGKRKPYDGISTVPAPSGLWFNALGHRIGPNPLYSYANTRWLVDSILEEPGGYTWCIMNRKIAEKELNVSLSRYFTAIRKKDLLLLLKNLLFGDPVRINTLLSESPEDFFMADSLSQLIGKMNEKSLFGFKIDEQRLTSEVRFYDSQIEKGSAFHNDDQLRRLANYRQYLPYRLQSCKNQKIEDPKAGPLMALRSFLISRKSLGGIQTNLECRVLKKDGTPFQRIYAIGEAAGFGGGGIHGKGSPEGTFLGSCILTAITFARH